MKKISLLVVFLLMVGSVSAQSLKREKPYPLQAGINKGTADSLIGIQYWYFYAVPGSSKMIVRFPTPTSLYGAQPNTVLTITMSDEKMTWRVTKTVTSNRNSSEAVFTAEKVKTGMKILVSVAPPNQKLIRMGGDYEIEVKGDVEFDEIKNEVDPIVRTYDSKVNSYGATKFLADGTLETSDGLSGTWKVFDAEKRIYTVLIDKFRFAVKYRPGYGLVKPDEPNQIVFQEVQ